MTSTERTTYYSVLGLLIALLLPYTKHLLTAWGLRSAYILASFSISVNTVGAKFCVVGTS